MLVMAWLKKKKAHISFVVPIVNSLRPGGTRTAADAATTVFFIPKCVYFKLKKFENIK